MCVFDSILNHIYYLTSQMWQLAGGLLARIYTALKISCGITILSAVMLVHPHTEGHKVFTK